MTRLDPAERSRAPLGVTADGRALGDPHQVGPREDHHPRPPKRPDWFAEEPAGEQTTLPEGVECIEQHEVEVTRQPAMLEPIVEDEQLRLELLDRDLGEPDAVAILEVGDV